MQKQNHTLDILYIHLHIHMNYTYHTCKHPDTHTFIIYMRVSMCMNDY